MDAAVHDELLQRDAGDLAAHRVERGDDDGLGRVVDDEVNARRRFEGADVAALAADDAALHVVVGQRHHGNGGLGHVVGGALLDGQRDDVAGLLVGLFLGPGFDLAHHDGGVMVGVLLDAADEDVLGVLHGHVGDAFEFLLLLLMQLLRFLLYALSVLVLGVELFFARFEVVGLLVQLFLALRHAALHAPHFAAPVADFLVQIAL